MDEKKQTPTAIGLLIKKLRESKRITQEKLANDAIVSIEAIKLLEAGKSKKPQSKTAEQLAKYFKVDPNIFLDYELAEKYIEVLSVQKQILSQPSILTHNQDPHARVIDNYAATSKMAIVQKFEYVGSIENNVNEISTLLRKQQKGRYRFTILLERLSVILLFFMVVFRKAKAYATGSPVIFTGIIFTSCALLVVIWMLFNSMQTEFEQPSIADMTETSTVVKTGLDTTIHSNANLSLKKDSNANSLNSGSNADTYYIDTHTRAVDNVPGLYIGVIQDKNEYLKYSFPKLNSVKQQALLFSIAPKGKTSILRISYDEDVLLCNKLREYNKCIPNTELTECWIGEKSREANSSQNVLPQIILPCTWKAELPLLISVDYYDVNLERKSISMNYRGINK